MREYYERHNANVAPWVHTLARRRPPRTRAPARRSPRSSARRPRRVVFTKNATEAINLVAYALGNAATRRPVPALRSAPATRSSSPRWSTTPTSCRGSCSASAPARRCAGSALTDEGRLDLSDLDDADQRAHQARLVRARVQHPRHGQPGRRASSPGPARSARWSCSTPRQSVPHLPVDVADAGRRLPRLHRAQDARADRHRRAVGPGRAARRDAAVPRRRLDDRDGHDGAARPSPPPPSGSRPAPADRPGGRAGAAVDYLTGLGMDAIAAHEHELTAYALDALHEVPGLRIFGPATPSRPRRRDLVRPSTGIHPHDVGPGARRRGRRRARRPPLRPADLPALRRPGDDPGVVLPLHHDRRDRRAGRRVSGRCRSSSGCRDAASSRSTRRSSWTTTSTRTDAGCASRSTPRCTTSTRPAATRSRCGCSSTAAWSATSPTRAWAARSARPARRVMYELVIGRTVDEALDWPRSSCALMQSQGPGRAGRGRAGGRRRVRRRGEVPGAGQVRAAVLDGVKDATSAPGAVGPDGGTA